MMVPMLVDKGTTNLCAAKHPLNASANRGETRTELSDICYELLDNFAYLVYNDYADVQRHPRFAVW